MQRQVNSKRRKEAERAALKLREQYQAKKRQELEAKHRNISEKSVQWNEQILPRWSELCESKQVGDLCMKGIPPSIRGKVWPLLIGNNLKINFELFQNLVALAELAATEAEMESGRRDRRNRRAAEKRVAAGEDADKVEEDEDDHADAEPVQVEREVEREWQQLRRKITNEGLSRITPLEDENLTEEQRGDRGSVAYEMEREWQQLKRKITNEGMRPLYDTFDSPARTLKLPTSPADDCEEGAADRVEGDDTGLSTPVEGEASPIVLKERADSDPGVVVKPYHKLESPLANADLAQSALTAGTEEATVSIVLDDSGNSAASEIDQETHQETHQEIHQGAEGADSGEGEGEGGGEGEGEGEAADESCFYPDSPLVRRDRHSVTYLVDAGLLVGTPVPAVRGDKAVDSPMQPDYNILQVVGESSSVSPFPFPNPDPSCSEDPDTGGHSVWKDNCSDDGKEDSVEAVCSQLNNVSVFTQYSDAIVAGDDDDEEDVGLGQGIDLEEEEEGAGLIEDPIDIAAAVAHSGDVSMRVSPPRRRQTVAVMDQTPEHIPASRHRSLGSCTSSLEIQRLLDEEQKASPSSNSSATEVAGGSVGPNSSGLSIAVTPVAEVQSPKINPVPTLPLKRVTSLGALSSSSTSMSKTSSTASALIQAVSSGTPPPHPHPSSNNSSLSARGSATRSVQSSASPPPNSPDPVSRRHTIKLIEFDIPRTFPTLAFFHDGGPLHVGLVRVLKAYACYRADVGYVQGMSYIVSMLLLYMDELQAFQSLANLLSRRGNMDFYRLKKFAIDAYVLCFDFFFKQHLPLLYMHLKGEGVTSEMYLMDWNLSLFSKALPLEVAARLWDVYLFEGEVFVTRAALGILRMYAPKLCTLSMEEIMSFLINLPTNVDADVLLANIDQIRISKRRYEEMRNKMTAELQSRVNSRMDQSTTPGHDGGAERRPSTSAFKGIKRAIRATFLGTSSSSQSLVDGVPSPHSHSPGNTSSNNTKPFSTPSDSSSTSTSTSAGASAGAGPNGNVAESEDGTAGEPDTSRDSAASRQIRRSSSNTLAAGESSKSSRESLGRQPGQQQQSDCVVS